MPARPNWYEENWKRLDKDSNRKIRTTCPKCGSDKTYYNEMFKVWRCGSCENSFIVKGVKVGKPWWKRIWGRGK